MVTCSDPSTVKSKEMSLSIGRCPYTSSNGGISRFGTSNTGNPRGGGGHHLGTKANPGHLASLGPRIGGASGWGVSQMSPSLGVTSGSSSDEVEAGSLSEHPPVPLS